MKAFLTYHNAPYQKTHNLVALLDAAEKIDSSTAKWLQAAKTLTPYATEFRYPGESADLTTVEGEEALDHAEGFLRSLREKLRHV